MGRDVTRDVTRDVRGCKEGGDIHCERDVLPSVNKPICIPVLLLANYSFPLQLH